jgi:hypothetical protein
MRRGRGPVSDRQCYYKQTPGKERPTRSLWLLCLFENRDCPRSQAISVGCASLHPPYKEVLRKVACTDPRDFPRMFLYRLASVLTRKVGSQSPVKPLVDRAVSRLGRRATAISVELRLRLIFAEGTGAVFDTQCCVQPVVTSLKPFWVLGWALPGRRIGKVRRESRASSTVPPPLPLTLITGLAG